MASVCGIAAVSNLGLAHCSTSKSCVFLATRHQPDKLKLQSCPRISLFTGGSHFHDSRVPKSAQLDVYITSDDEQEMGEGFFAAIERTWKSESTEAAIQRRLRSNGGEGAGDGGEEGEEEEDV